MDSEQANKQTYDCLSFREMIRGQELGLLGISVSWASEPCGWLRWLSLAGFWLRWLSIHTSRVSIWFSLGQMSPHSISQLMPRPKPHIIDMATGVYFCVWGSQRGNHCDTGSPIYNMRWSQPLLHTAVQIPKQDYWVRKFPLYSKGCCWIVLSCN